MRRAARCDTSCTQRQSTMLGRCGPCCSVAPIGTMTMALRAASALISEAFSLDHSISDILRTSLERGPPGPHHTHERTWRSALRSERRHGLHRQAQPFLVQAVELAVHGVEEDEAVEPAHEVLLAHAHAHMGGA